MNLHHSLFKYFIAASISALLLSSAAQAMQPRGGGFIGMIQNSTSFGSLGDVDRTARQFRLLDLSDDQRQQLWTIADSFRVELREQQDALSDGHGAIQEMLISGNYDPVRLSALADNQGNIVARMIEPIFLSWTYKNQLKRSTVKVFRLKTGVTQWVKWNLSKESL